MLLSFMLLNNLKRKSIYRNNRAKYLINVMQALVARFLDLFTNRNRQSCLFFVS